jgi:site-specific DNA recombinase
MATHPPFKREFDKLAQDGAIGDPLGIPAYAYIRVSDDEQSKEGRYGLFRQIEHIHQKARDAGYRVTWDHVYADDFTGFIFEYRPALTLLRAELAKPDRAANALIIESLDRLSRDSDWHQGYLLHEMKTRGVKVLFWEEFASRVERAVKGAIAQDGMEQAKARMKDGNRKKAENGRVNSRTPAYGYQFVDANGKSTPSARKDTHYAPVEPQASAVRLIFSQYIGGTAMQGIANVLTAHGYPTPRGKKQWDRTSVRYIIRNALYKGEYVANHYKTWVEERRNERGEFRLVQRKALRPQSEWIYVPVPALVSSADWELAQRMLDKNKQTASRNAREPYLLTGLIRCAICGRAYVGYTRRARNSKSHRYYRCDGKSHGRNGATCANKGISCDALDEAVWAAVVGVITDSERLKKALDRNDLSDQNAAIVQQIDFIQSEIASRDGDERLLWDAYRAGAFDADEYSARRIAVKRETENLQAEARRLRGKLIPLEIRDARKGTLLKFAESVRQLDPAALPSMEFRKRILKLLIDRIMLDVTANIFTVEGVIGGSFALSRSPIEMTSADKFHHNYTLRYDLAQNQVVDFALLPA